MPKRPFRRDTSPSSQSQSQSSSTESRVGPDEKTGNPSLDRRFSRSWLRSRLKSDSTTGTIGPLGLRPLHLSAEPLVDLVFVHGLRGGSIKTWRKGDDPRLYWPQNWLPLEPDFQNANIHTFGYNSDFRETKDSILNVHDFGRALLGELRTSPHIRTRKSVCSLICNGELRMLTRITASNHSYRSLNGRSCTQSGLTLFTALPATVPRILIIQGLQSRTEGHSRSRIWTAH